MFRIVPVLLIAATTPALAQVKPSQPVAPLNNPKFTGRTEMQSLVVGNGGVPVFTYPFAGFSQAKTGMLSSVTGLSESGPEFAGSFQMVSNGGSSNKYGNFKVALTSVYQALPGAADGWAANFVASSAAGVDPSTGLTPLELNINNNHFEATDNPASPYITPLYITGSGSKTSMAAAIVAGDRQLYRDGIHFEDRSPNGQSIIKQATINDRSKSPNILITDTAHVNGIDFINGTFSGFPFRSPGFSVDGAGNVNTPALNANAITLSGNAGAAMSIGGSHTLGVDLINGTYGAYAFRSPGFTVDGVGGVSTPALQITGSGSTGDASDLSARLRGSTKALALGQDTSIGHSVARFGTPGVETCAGNDAVDDSVAINAAITYVASLGGGKVTFPQSADCRAANPIIMRRAVQLWGHGGIGVDGGVKTSRISPSASMDALVKQADPNELLSSIGIHSITFDGRRASSPNAPSNKTITVGALVNVKPIGSRFENNGFFYSSGDGLYLRNDLTSFAWINWITGNQVSQNLGWGARLEITDSIVSMNYFGVNGVKGVAGGGKTATENGSGGCIWTRNFGNIRFLGNQVEVCNVGALEQSVDEGSFPAYGNYWTGNFFDLNNTSVQFKHGALSAGQMIDYTGTFSNNRFSTVEDNHVTIDNYISSGTIANSFFNPTATGAAAVRWLGSSSGKWSLSGQFLASVGTRFQNMPADTALQFAGAASQARIPGLTASPASDGTAVLGVDAGAGQVPTMEFRQAGSTKYRQRINPADGSLITSNVEFGQDAYKVLFNGQTQFLNPVGFNGAAPVGKCTLSASLPTDGSATNASIATAINGVRSCLINNGLAQ